MPPDEEESRPGNYAETANQKTSHDQATSATHYSGGGGHAGLYAAAHPFYRRKGWAGILKLKPRSKFPPPAGYTGGDSADPTDEEIDRWAREEPDGNLAVRLPLGIVGIDVDNYGGKTGAQTLAEAEKRWGPLPPTYRSTSREDGVSGIKLFRVLAGTRLRGALKFGELGIGDIDIIQRHHRYVVAWPSIHPEGRPYRWIDEADGAVVDTPPGPDDLPELPETWIESLRIKLAHNNSEPARNTKDKRQKSQNSYDVSDAMTAGRPSQKVALRLGEALADLAEGVNRHDTMCPHVLALLRHGERGEPGVEVALETLYRRFVDTVGGDRVAGEPEAEAEFARMVSNAEGMLADSQGDQAPDDEDAARAYEPDWRFADGEPVPLTETVEVPPWPVDALPKPIADMVAGVAEATQTDPAMPATSALSALSACTGGHAEIEIRSGWREPLCVYTATIAAPGERKSAVQMFMTRPIHEVERQLVADGAADRMAAEERKQVATKAVERQRNRAAKAGEDEARAAFDEVIGAAQIADGIEVPPVPRLLADDITPEAAASLLAEQGGRLAIISAEGGIFDIIAGRYSPKAVPNMDLWLKGHSGDPLRVDRKGRPPEHIPRPALTLGLMIQPSVLGAIAANQQFRGRGFLARILYARPRSKVGHRKTPAPPVDLEVEKSYGTTLRELARGMRGWGGDPAVLTLTEDAQQQIQRIEAAVEPTLAGDGELASLADWGAKYVGAVARIAGMLHLAEHGAEKGPREPVSAATVMAATRIGEYFKAAAINAFAEMGTDQRTADAVYLLERIRLLGQDEVSERDVHVASSRSRFPTKADLKLVLSLLVDHGYLAPLPKPEPTGGRPASPRYRVHPRITEDTKATEGGP